MFKKILLVSLLASCSGVFAGYTYTTALPSVTVVQTTPRVPAYVPTQTVVHTIKKSKPTIGESIVACIAAVGLGCVAAAVIVAAIKNPELVMCAAAVSNPNLFGPHYYVYPACGPHIVQTTHVIW